MSRPREMHDKQLASSAGRSNHARPRQNEVLALTHSETRIPAESLITFARTAFERLGLGSAHAKMGAEILIDANLMGLDTHGIRIPRETSAMAFSCAGGFAPVNHHVILVSDAIDSDRTERQIIKAHAKHYEVYEGLIPSWPATNPEILSGAERG